MELSVDYECPECQKVSSWRFAEIAPGKIRQCSDCGTPVILTLGGLQELQRRLEEYCRN